MTPRPHPVKALGLCSGGLDSTLAGLLLRRQGIDVTWIAFETPFFSARKARQAARRYDVPLRVEPITDVYLPMLRNPKCGYGKYMNPCLDCHTLMFRLAAEVMAAEGFHFLFSGEVLGQRPMSQTAQSLRYVEKNSGCEGYVLRPLSARRMPETIPEQQGWVDREQLLDFSGRSRKPQMALAAELGVTDYPAPAGGCLLTDKGFSARLRDLFAHRGDPSENELHLLRFGRHFRLSETGKLVVGRTKGENETLEHYRDPDRDMVLKVADHPGPLGLLSQAADRQTQLLAATIVAGYSKAPELTPVTVAVTTPDGPQTLQVIGLPPRDVRRFLI
jgi:tRNA-specific 2-thiouridylase